MSKGSLTEENLLKKISELKKENQYLKKIISELPGIIYWKDKKGRYLGGNNEAVKYLNDKGISKHSKMKLLGFLI